GGSTPIVPHQGGQCRRPAGLAVAGYPVPAGIVGPCDADPAVDGAQLALDEAVRGVKDVSGYGYVFFAHAPAEYAGVVAVARDQPVQVVVGPRPVFVGIDLGPPVARPHARLVE